MTAAELFRDNNTPIEKMVAIGTTRLGLSEESIRKAADIVHMRVENGEDIKPIRLAWTVYAVAKQFKRYVDRETDNRISKMDTKLDTITKWLEQPRWKRMFVRYQP